MNELPAQVLLRLGPSPLELTRLGASRVFRGNDMLAKLGPEDRIAREAFLFGEASALMPIGVPVLVEAGPGWILIQDPGLPFAAHQFKIDIVDVAIEPRGAFGVEFLIERHHGLPHILGKLFLAVRERHRVKLF